MLERLRPARRRHRVRRPRYAVARMPPFREVGRQEWLKTLAKWSGAECTLIAKTPFYHARCGKKKKIRFTFRQRRDWHFIRHFLSTCVFFLFFFGSAMFIVNSSADLGPRLRPKKPQKGIHPFLVEIRFGAKISNRDLTDRFPQLMNFRARSPSRSFARGWVPLPNDR